MIIADCLKICTIGANLSHYLIQSSFYFSMISVKCLGGYNNIISMQKCIPRFYAVVLLPVTSLPFRIFLPFLIHTKNHMIFTHFLPRERRSYESYPLESKKTEMIVSSFNTNFCPKPFVPPI